MQMIALFVAMFLFGQPATPHDDVETAQARSCAMLGTFVLSPVSDVPEPRELIAIDITGDGSVDLVYISDVVGRELFHIVHNPASGSVDRLFADRESEQAPNNLRLRTFGIDAVDYDGDGDIDVAVCARDGYDGLFVFANNGVGGFFLKQAALFEQRGAWDVVSGDFDGDGDIDLAISFDHRRGIHLWLNDGSGHFESLEDPLESVARPYRLVVADFNGDGADDLAAAGYADDRVRVFVSTPDGLLKASIDIPTGASPRGIAAGDFDGDGRVDLTTANRGETQDVSMLWNDFPDGTFLVQTERVSDPTPESVARIDLPGLDHDGLAVNCNGFVQIWSFDKERRRSVCSRLPTAARGLGVPGIGDLDGDDDPDIVAGRVFVNVGVSAEEKSDSDSE